MSYLSKTENRILMAQAREALQGRWGLAIGTFVVYSLIIGAACALVMGLIGIPILIVITGPMAVGMSGFALSLSRKESARLPQMFDGFNKFGTSLLACILCALFVALWSLLFVIPGYIAALRYSQTFYVIAENESIKPLEAIAKSKALMQGNKWKLLCLCFRFTGWALLCVLSLGIGYLWLVPYTMVSAAQFYDDLKPIADAPEEAPTAT